MGFDDVVKALQLVDIASKIYIEKLNTKPRIAIAVGEKYFFRAENALAATTIVIEVDKSETIVKVIATGARSGIFDFFDLGSSRDYTYLVLDSIARRLGVGYELIAEVHRLDSSKASKLYTVL